LKWWYREVVIMPKDKRYWYGKCGHVLGEIKVVVYGDRQVKALAVYEQSLEVPPVVTPEIRCTAVGSLDGIRCTKCGRRRDWIIGQDAVDSLLEQRHQPLPSDV
jgi:hypothetical protein